MANEFVPGFNDEKDDSLKMQLDKVQEVDNCWKSNLLRAIWIMFFNLSIIKFKNL